MALKTRNMKKSLYIISALLLLTACGKNGGEQTELRLEQKLCTEWHSTTLPLDGDIYINFEEGRIFELYQQIGEGAYRLYRGTWSLEEDLLTGRYNDGEDWAAAYSIAIEEDVLTLTSVNDAAEVSTFAKAEIPAEIKETCETIVKSL